MGLVEGFIISAAIALYSRLDNNWKGIFKDFEDIFLGS